MVTEWRLPGRRLWFAKTVLLVAVGCSQGVAPNPTCPRDGSVCPDATPANVRDGDRDGAATDGCVGDACGSCGTLGLPCCAGRRCEGTLTCGASDRCAAPAPSCGDAGQRCCAGDRCNAGRCAAGTCVPSEPTFAPCTSDAMCPRCAVCDLTYPGGLCTVVCTTDDHCGAVGTCGAFFRCVPRCHFRADVCRSWSGVCSDPAAHSRFNACYPSCYSTPPTGLPSCGGGRVCDRDRGWCLPPRDVGIGAPIGASVRGAGDELCRANLLHLPASMSGFPTGFTNGYCITRARAPAPSEYAPGRPWPQGNCPDGAVAMPGWSDFVEGDPVTCYRGCRADSDCRVSEGYGCFMGPARGRPTGERYSTGACLPIDCMDGVHRCPPDVWRCSAAEWNPRIGVCH